MSSIAVCYILHDDAYYLAGSIDSTRAAGEVFTFISRVPWHDHPGDWQAAAEIARAGGAEVVLGEWTTELAHRQAAIETLKERGYTHALIPDGDEIMEPGLLRSLTEIAQTGMADRVYVEWDTYWKSPEYVIRPRERFRPCMLIDLNAAVPVGGRNFEGGRPLRLSAEYGIVHHLSYAGPDERIRRKISTWGHRDEVLPGWFERVWLAWDSDKLMRNLHPTHPGAYGFAERIHVPGVLEAAMRTPAKPYGPYGTQTDEGEEARAKPQRRKEENEEHRIGNKNKIASPCRASVSVVIPLHGRRDDLRLCLDSLDRCADLIHEVIVIDNASPDDAADEVRERIATKEYVDVGDSLPSPSEGRALRRGAGGEVNLIPNPSNVGFAAACNQGIAASSGEIILFLNSDTVVPRAGLVRLMEALTASGSIAAAGPFTNYAGHGQRIDPTYTSLDTMELFAEDFAARGREDIETDMLVGFCLAVRRSVLNEIGGFDERFGLGTFEDNDLCYRIRRAGYRLVIAANSFVHHSGSKTMGRMEGKPYPQPYGPYGISQISNILDMEDNNTKPPNPQAKRPERKLGIGGRDSKEPTASTPTPPKLGAGGRNGETAGRCAAIVPPFDPVALLRRNELLYREKWRDDIESGYASHLSGLAGERIVFRPDRHPDVRMRRILKDARRADTSLCMIVRDEERVLGDCLRSAKPFFREMIVIDTGSTDRTKEIAKEMGARVYDFPWTNSFSEARNESLKYAKGRWIFWLDADDTLPLSSGEAILDAALNAPPAVVGFVVPVQFVEEGEGAGTRVDHVKLFRNLPGVKFEGRIHEQILPSLREACSDRRGTVDAASRRVKAGPEVGDPHSLPDDEVSSVRGTEKPGQIARIDAVVLHSGYDTSPEGQAKKRERDALLLKLDLEERPDHPFVLFNLGMTDHYGGELEGAVAWLKRCLEVSPPTDSHVRKAYALLALSQRQTGDIDGCLATLRQGLTVTPGDPELHFHLGHTLTDSGDLKEAKAHYEQALQSRIEEHFSSVDIGILGFKTYHNLGSVCRLMEDYKGAREWWSKAIEAAPHFLPSILALFDTAVAAGDFATAKRMVEAAFRAEGPGENWLRLVILHSEALAGKDAAHDCLQQALAQYPRSPAVGMAWSRHLLQSSREQEAIPHLHALARAGVAEAAYFLGVSAIRSGQLEDALDWMRRAHELNPNHEDTTRQITALEGALGEQSVPSGPVLTLADAVTQVAADLGLDRDALWSYTKEDTIGGYYLSPALPVSPPPDPSPHNLKPIPCNWPGGSVWEDEGRLLYGLVRALKPERIVEVGSLVGCSTSHLALACKQNGSGTVYAVDPALEFSRVDKTLLDHIVPVPEDVFAWQPPEGQVSFLFEDGSHLPGFTGATLTKLRPHLAPGAVVISHDYLHARLGKHVAAEFNEVLGECPGATVGSVRIAPSDCGLGYARLGVAAG